MDAARFLLQRGANPTVQNSGCLTPAELAERERDPEITELLAQWIRTHPPFPGVPKTPLLIEGFKVWIKTEKLAKEFPSGDVAFRMNGGYLAGRQRARRKRLGRRQGGEHSKEGLSTEVAMHKTPGCCAGITLWKRKKEDREH